MTVFVVSTMTDSVGYTVFSYINNGGGGNQALKLPIPKKKITIWGGARLPSLKSGFGEMAKDGEGHPMWTAAGVVTPVSDENFEILKDHWLFKKHQEDGYVKVVSHDITGNHKAVTKEVRSMETHDNATQLTPDTVKKRVGDRVKIKELENEQQYRL